MQLNIRNMNTDFAEEILDWKYAAPYDFYNNELTSDALKEMLENQYYAVLDQNDKLVGFFCIGDSARVPIGNQFGAYSEELIDIGIGMKPELTGQGFGFTFFSFILEHIQGNFNDVQNRLTVAKFNQRAIHLYEKFGFVKKIEFKKGSTAFITMVK
ncbi:hypothetical protein WQ57_09840 [Mesobacillus campisalis]|uniref:N-acetyltransferase domain-containing protein n=1 Tax=Mesobacillus campisalis TaxID=1408103 RepID=A0A0M2SVB7_9BACI|nr:GNAT family N-acetyltransferase [Mesobacillus campisalis]KKK38113.1 hypothetical protein WQ57_09840 [Mesobacillus campisalis]